MNIGNINIEDLRRQHGYVEEPEDPPYSKSSPYAESDATTTGTGIGTLAYGNTQTGYAAGALPTVTDPDVAFANIARGQHERYIRNFRDFEDALVGAREDRSLIKAARTDAVQQTEIAAGIAERNRQRYGYTQTKIEQSEASRAAQRSTAIGLAGGLNTARLAQREANQKVLGDLINIGQGVNRSSLSQLGTAGENAVARKNAYRQAKAGSKAQTANMIGSMAAMIAMIAI